MRIYEDELIFIEVETSQIPWLKIFPIKKYKELSDCDTKTREQLLETMLLVEKQMIKYYSPIKVNIFCPHLSRPLHNLFLFQSSSHSK